ncbi:MAG: hypothetical protein EHM85_19590 [Desulfobacteraceae bacterium]|nr:MAG: hypothetical protein EHM85_19590 [Desulfobacteraceae bacterium]
MGGQPEATRSACGVSLVHHIEKNWLVLVEAFTSHGPVNPKRRQELKELFLGDGSLDCRVSDTSDPL